MCCLSCSKCFKNDTGVLQHLNQPRSQCYSWNDNLVQISSESRLLVLPQDELAFNEDTVIYNDMDMDMDVDIGIDLGMYEDEHASVEAGYEEEVYDGAVKTYSIGTTFMKTFNSDEYAVERMDNPYFPFTSKLDWEMSLLSHSLLVDSFNFIPWKIYESAECVVHIYYGFMTGDRAWKLQECLPDGVTPLGVVLSSDKTKPLKQATCLGVMMSDPAGFRSSMLANIRAVANFVLPSELTAFFEECKQHFLNGVLTPFWLDWLTADPSSFLMPKLLHHLHKMFWDHNLRWCTKVVGVKEIDFHFALLQMCIGYHAFKEGISDLKQTSGRDHRNVQHYIIGIIADAAPAEFITAIQALVEFRYLAQAPWFTDEKLIELNGSL
ncbi:hypothetical protein BDR06DRAFT_970282 [Suillus hirtellus]|nr:hypothetical protein BDR06DRAFT_970282 [Suillus hirtellus]